AQPRYRNYAMSKPNDPLYANQWNFPAIDMERAWDIQPGATTDIIVAVLDSGVAFHSGTFRYNSRFPFRVTPGGPLYPALGIVDVPFAAAPELGASGSTRFVAPRDFIWDDNFPVDLDSHGTHVTGTVGQLTNNSLGVAGMAYNVRIMPVKIIQAVWDEIFSSPNEGTDDVVARGIRYAADNGAKVINLSIGRSSGGPAPVVTDAMRYAVGRGVFIAVASGNTRNSGNQPNRLAQHAPDINGMVAVGGSAARSTRPTTRPRARSWSWRRPAATSAPAARAPASCSRRSTWTCSKPTIGHRRNTGRRGPTRFPITTSRAPRWRRRTSRALPRC
ncbi:MAG: hypothetical protein RJA55_902, partial [Acidobacteriota bacterium]